MNTKRNNSLKYVYNNFNQVKELSKSLMRKNRKKFTMNEMSRIINSTVEKYTSALPSQVGFKLPKLKKIDKSKDN